MFDLSKVASLANRGGLLFKKHEPEILVGLGLVGFGASVVTACHATLKIDDILAEHNETMEKIDSVAGNEKFAEEYSEQDAVHDKTIVTVQTGVKLIRTYLPAVTLFALSTACILRAHNVMSSRNLALAAAYKASEEAFRAYRDRVKDELGEEKDQEFRYGVKAEDVKVKEKDPETGKTKTVTKKEIKSDGKQIGSQYARFFDEGNPNWYKHPDKRVTAEQNKFFLMCIQNKLNDRLKTKGHVFLNEVYEALGIEDSTAGAVVGWIWDPSRGYDTEIDFGIWDDDNEIKRMFVNGDETSILLDFNVMGVIYDLI